MKASSKQCISFPDVALFIAIASSCCTCYCPHILSSCHSSHSLVLVPIAPSALFSSLCFALVPLLCYRLPALSSSSCSAIVPHLFPLRHRPPSLPSSSSPSCCVIVPVLCHYPLAVSSSTCCVIVHLLCHCPSAVSSSTCYVIVPLLCHCPPAVLCHCPPTVSSFHCCVIVHLLCHAVSMSTYCVIVHLLRHRPPAVSLSPCSVIIPNLFPLCHRPHSLPSFIISLLCHRPPALS